MPKGQEEGPKSEQKPSESSEAQLLKPDRRMSVETSAAQLEERKESISSAPQTSSTLSVESIVTEEKESISSARNTVSLSVESIVTGDDKPAEVRKSDTIESQSSVRSLLQPPAAEKTRVSPVKEFLSNLAQKLHLSSLSKKPPPKTSPESEKYVPGQELMEECLVQLPLKDKKTQTERLPEKRTRQEIEPNTPSKRAALFLSPEIYDETDTSTSRSTTTDEKDLTAYEETDTSTSQSMTTDERDLITPSPTPILDASKMVLAIRGHEPLKSEPGPFQKLKKFIGLEKEAQPGTSQEADTKCELEARAKATQTTSEMDISTVSVQGVMDLKEQNEKCISTSESMDCTEFSRGTSEHSLTSSVNVETFGISPQKSPVEFGAATSFSADSDKHLKPGHIDTEKKPVLRKMPNPVIETLKHEETQNVEDEEASTSPRKRESGDISPKSILSFGKSVISESILKSQDEEMNVKETAKEYREADDSIAESNIKDLSISTTQDEEMKVEETSIDATEAGEIVAESGVKCIFISASRGEEMNVEERSQEANQAGGRITESDVKNLSISKSREGEMNVEETPKEVTKSNDKVTESVLKDTSVLTSGSQSEEMNLQETCKESTDVSGRIRKSKVKKVSFLLAESEEKEMNVEETSKQYSEDDRSVAAPDVKDVSFCTSTGQSEENRNVEKTSEEASKAGGKVAESELRHLSLFKSSGPGEKQMNIEETSKGTTEVGGKVTESEDLSSASTTFDAEVMETT